MKCDVCDKKIVGEGHLTSGVYIPNGRSVVVQMSVAAPEPEYPQLTVYMD